MKVEVTPNNLGPSLTQTKKEHLVPPTYKKSSSWFVWKELKKKDKIKLKKIMRSAISSALATPCAADGFYSYILQNDDVINHALAPDFKGQKIAARVKLRSVEVTQMGFVD